MEPPAHRHSHPDWMHASTTPAPEGPIAWTADAAGHIAAGLEFWCAFTGQAPEEAAGDGWLAAVHPDERAQARAAWVEAVAEGTAYTYEHRVRCAQGDYHLMRAWATPLRAGDGNIQAWVGVCMESRQAPAGAHARERTPRDKPAGATVRQRALQREAAIARRKLRALQALMDTTLTHLSLDNLLRELLSRLQAVVRVDNAAILLLDEGARVLTVHAARGPEEAVVAKARISLGQGFAGRIAASRAPLIVNDLSRMEVVNPLLSEALHSVVGVPLLLDGRVLGVVHVGTTRRRRFTAGDVELLQWAADRIALGIERARLFDASQQARAQAADQAHELEELLEAMPDAVMVFDHDGGVRRMNVAARQLLGLSFKPEFYARPLADRGYRASVTSEAGEPLPEDEWPFMRILRGEVLMGPDAVDVRYHVPGGVERQVNVIGAPLRNAPGRVTGAVCVIRDVTERRQLEQRTREALAAMLAVAEALVAPAAGGQEIGEIGEIGEGGRAEDAGTSSPAPSRAEAGGTASVALRLAKLTRDVLACERVAILAIDQQTEVVRPLAVTGLSPEHWQIWNKGWRGTARLPEIPLLAPAARLAPGDALSLDLTRPRYRDRPNPYGSRQMLIAPMHVGRQLVGLLAIDHGEAAHAYSDHEKVLAGGVARLAALVVERERLLREREAAQAQALALEEANRQMNEFLSIASHELKTPVTVIKTNLHMLQREQQRHHQSSEPAAEGGRSQELAERALRGMDRLMRLVDDLLDVSRIQAGYLELRRVPCDLRAVVREVVAEQREIHPWRGFSLREPRSAVWVSADLDRLRQVAINYLTNAVKYSPKERPVTVRVSVEGGAARVAVEDQGPGIPPRELAQLWQLFHRVPDIEVQAGSAIGLGLGLHICKTIIEHHGGQVGVQSVVGRGSTFWFTLPLGSPPDSPTAGDHA